MSMVSKSGVTVPRASRCMPSHEVNLAGKARLFPAERATLRGSAGSHLPTHHPSGAALHRCPPACCAQSTCLWLAAGPEARWTLVRPFHPVQVALKATGCSIWRPGTAFCLPEHSTGRHPELAAIHRHYVFHIPGSRASIPGAAPHPPVLLCAKHRWQKNRGAPARSRWRA